jgi:toxin YoeB
MKINFTETGWQDYTYRQSQDKKTLKKINFLIDDIRRNGYDGIGKPEQLSGDLAGWWSRRIDAKNRLVYRLSKNDTMEIAQCRGHYGDNWKEPADMNRTRQISPPCKGVTETIRLAVENGLKRRKQAVPLEA